MWRRTTRAGTATTSATWSGDAGLLAWNEWSQRSDDSGAQNASLKAWHQGRQRRVLRGPDSFGVVAVDGTHLLVLRPDGSLVVVAVNGNVLRRFPARGSVRGATLNGKDVVVISGGTLTDLDLPTGKVKRTWHVPPKALLTDVQDGVAADIGVVRADGSGLRRVVSPGADGEPRWVPASRLAPFEGAKVAPPSQIQAASSPASARPLQPPA